ncbi:MAG: DNA polymerase III subunit beta [Actinomycetota bacterium]|nr:DNA polymerase III subunit beta [Actinomycetota bacterium]
MSQVETSVTSGLRLTCSADELARRVALVARAVSTRATVQILSGVLVTAADGRVELSATDMDLSLRTSLDAEVEGPGRIVVPGRLLVEVTRLLPETTVELEHRADEGTVSVTCGSAQYRLHTYSAEDFPRLPDVEETPIFSVPRDVFLGTVARVSRAASRDESRPVLTGILVRLAGGRLVMAATDSYRLAVKATSLDVDAPALDAIVPARALAELGRITQDAEDLRLGLHENHVLFGTGDAWLATRRIDGQFPDYEQLLPDTFEHELTLPREDVLDVVRRVAVMAQRNSPLRLRFSDGELTISAQTQDVGEARESLPIAFAAEPLEIGFNADFLREGIESVDADELELKLISPLRPGLIRAQSDDFSYLIMPIRLAG